MATPGSPGTTPISTAGRWRTSAPSSGCTTRCRSTPAVWACSRETTARRRAISACRWSGSASSIAKGYFDQRLNARRVAGGQRRGVRRQRDATRPGYGAESPAVAHDGRDQRANGSCAGLADDGGPGADLPARYQSGGESPGRPGADEQALRRRTRAAPEAGVDSRRRRRAGASGDGDRPRRVACQRRPRRVHAAGAPAGDDRGGVIVPGVGGHGCARRASSPPTPRCRRATMPSASTSWRRARGRYGRKWASTGPRSSGSARTPPCRASFT